MFPSVQRLTILWEVSCPSIQDFINPTFITSPVATQEDLKDFTNCFVDILACNLEVDHSCRTCDSLLVTSLVKG